MSNTARDTDEGARWGADQLRARAAAADARAGLRLARAIDDFNLPDDARLDDRLRAALRATLAALAAAVEGALRQHAARLLVARNAAGLAERLGAAHAPVLDQLRMAGMWRDPELLRELIARARQDLLSEALPVTGPDHPDTPSLLARLSGHPDGLIATAATAVLTAAGRRRATPVDPCVQTDLPAELHHRLIWSVAAALRLQAGAGTATDTALLDHALTEAALRNLAAHDEGDRVEAAAMRLAAAYGANADELPPLLVESLGDGRLALFIALLATALGQEYAAMRDVVLDPGGERLWLVLRALELRRDSIARIGLALGEGDTARDLDAFADALDAIAAIPADAARAALAPMMLHPDYRAAIHALAMGGAA